MELDDSAWRNGVEEIGRIVSKVRRVEVKIREVEQKSLVAVH